MTEVEASELTGAGRSGDRVGFFIATKHLPAMNISYPR
jgi:hypothetical protein